MIFNLSKKNIPITLLNGRITKKTYSRWKMFPNFSNTIFNKFNFCFAASKTDLSLLKKLGAKKVEFIGNLKFSQSENEKLLVDKNFKKFIKSKNLVWLKHHYPEEKLCGIVHKELKKKYKNLLTIIIPRHIERVSEIKTDLEKLNLKIHLDESRKVINEKTDIYLVNSYGKTKSFFSLCNNVFLGGSIIKHGGQNPLEAVRYGCNILHGPNVSNFSEIYNFLKRNKIAIRVNKKENMIYTLNKLFKKKQTQRK